ncbi:hypothetical protein Ae201684_018809 [Aphanomyces euteiches]|uniref:Uncharacterized protein n=1 Tax=Aphanomyces euteiches TaxID=100861 RepID=A0A6G0W4K7_9STRA|nr:hypothetical protein Ae201684_018809 [Aphanomyces euteiches]
MQDNGQCFLRPMLETGTSRQATFSRIRTLACESACRRENSGQYWAKDGKERPRRSRDRVVWVSCLGRSYPERIVGFDRAQRGRRGWWGCGVCHPQRVHSIAWTHKTLERATNAGRRLHHGDAGCPQRVHSIAWTGQGRSGVSSSRWNRPSDVYRRGNERTATMACRFSQSTANSSSLGAI